MKHYVRRQYLTAWSQLYMYLTLVPSWSKDWQLEHSDWSPLLGEEEE